MLKNAFNSLINIHSRSSQLKRLGSPDFYSPCKIAPSNYFRFVRGPEFTTVHGRDLIISNDSISGHFAQSVVFSAAPASGTFKLTYGGNDTTALNFNDSASTIQTALRLVTGLSQVLVTGTVAAGLYAAFPGFSTAPGALTVTASTLQDSTPAAVTETITATFVKWADPIVKKKDRIIDSIYGTLTIDEVVEIPDLGGSIMGFRCKCE